MMYIIYNSDGSINKKNINEYIQQGNSYANVLFVTVKDTDIEDYTCQAVITLPNGQNVGGIIEPSDEPVTIDDVEYNGYYITLDETCTLMAGAIRISIALTLDEVRTVTYPIYLNVNATPYDADAPVMISYNQYLYLTNLIESQSYVYNSTITMKLNGATVGTFNLNQSSNSEINYVVNKAGLGLGNVDNTSDATKKSNFTGSIANGNTGFVTGGDIYSYALLKNVDQDINSSKRFINDTELQFYIGSSNPASWYSINDENGNLSFSLSHYDVEEGTSVCDFKIQYNGENFYPTSANVYNLGTSSLYWKNVYASEYFLKGNTHSLGYEYLMTYIKTYSNSVSRKYYFAPSQFFPDANNTCDLGNSDYKFKDLYLAGKINGINIPTDTIRNDTFAVESEISKFLLDTTTTIADVKALMTVEGRDRFYVYSQVNGWQDKTAEIIAGDYDSATIINNKFESYVKEITVGQVGSRYLLLKHEKYNYWYMVEDYASQPITKTLIIVTNGTYPSRKNLCRVDAISYKHHLGVVIETSLTIEFDVIDRDENAITKDNFISRIFTSHVNSVLATIIDNRTSHGYGAVMLGKLSATTVGLYGAVVDATDGSTYNVLETPLTPSNFSSVVDTKIEL